MMRSVDERLFVEIIIDRLVDLWPRKRADRIVVDPYGDHLAFRQAGRPVAPQACSQQVAGRATVIGQGDLFHEQLIIVRPIRRDMADPNPRDCTASHLPDPCWEVANGGILGAHLGPR